MISKANAEHYIWGEKCDGWYLVNRQDMLVIHEKMPPETCEKRHYHSTSRQFFFVLSGVLTMELEGKEHQIGIQQGIEISRIEYQRCVKEGKTRYDIHGEPAGEVSAKEAQYARLQVARIKAKLDARRDAREKNYVTS